jgi:hypothetical protein
MQRQLHTHHDLALHCQESENKEVHNQNGPEHGHVENLKEREEECEER